LLQAIVSAQNTESIVSRRIVFMSMLWALGLSC
jgi:hypothetical protein